MKMIITAIFACMLLACVASSTEEEAKVAGDWLSGGYVVSHHHPFYSWGPWTAYSVFYDSTVFDPWYRTVAWPYLSDWYQPPFYYRSGVTVYPVRYYYPATYWWYDSIWRYPIYP